MASATLSTKGQLTVPSSVREKLGVAAGDRIEFVEMTDGSFKIIPAVLDVRELKGIASRKGAKKHLSIDDMQKIIARRGSGR